MPVYVYKNLTTGATFEVEQRITESALTADPVTGDPVKRLIQPVGIAFKGNGFYVNDSRGKNGASSSSRSEKTDIVKYDGAKGESGTSAGAKSEGAGKSESAVPTTPKSAPAASASD
jgi:predicted nucleic acid-binding Zn ribbon protein